MTISSTQANMIGTVIELVMMGVYIMMFIDHMKIMYKRRSKRVPYIYHLCTSIAIFVLTLLHAITQTWRVYTGFTSHMDIPNAPVEFYNKNNSWDSWVGTITYVLITLVSDQFFVYRTWVVWGKNYLVSIIPFLLFLGDIATAIFLLWSLFFSTDDPSFEVLLVASTSKYFFSVTLALTLTCTLLISYKVWSVARHVKPVLSIPAGGCKLSRMATIIFESAAIYSSLLTGMIIMDIHGIASFFILFKLLPPVIGIVFSSIIVSTSINAEDTSSGSGMSSMRFPSDRRKNDETAHTATSGSGCEGVQIHLETIADTPSRVAQELKVYGCSESV